jgi:hypothetical protein
MMRRLLLSGAFLLPTAAATAEPLHGLYVGGDLGANFLGTLTSSGSTTDIGSDVGPVGLAFVGWAFGNGLLVEIEGSDRADGIDNVSTLRANGLTVPLTNAGGDANTRRRGMGAGGSVIRSGETIHPLRRTPPARQRNRICLPAMSKTPS